MSAGDFQAARTRLTRWFLDTALPLWSAHGVDRVHGGFHETLDEALQPGSDPRRARLTARQIYVFTAAERLGWSGPARALVDHGLDFLTRHLIRPDGTVIASVTAEGAPVRADYDLYDYAFVLFALAEAARGAADRASLEAQATAILTALKARYRHPVIGFEETEPPSAPLKSNPHMHLMEACLAWGEVSASPVWHDLAGDLARLALTHLIDAETGALREYFTRDWRPMPDDTGRLVEPGHQFEWAWLLLRWGEISGDTGAIVAARQLIEIGESHGTTADHIAINELNNDFSERDASAKLWPQTERIKAWCALSERGDRDRCLARAARGVAALETYLAARRPGLWAEIRDADGTFRPGVTRASSLYHIVMALEVLHDIG